MRLKNKRLPLFFCLLVLGMSIAPAGWGVFAVQPARAQNNAKFEALALINRARLSNGLNPLAYSPQLDKAAQRHSDDMARNSFLSDAGSDDSTAKDRMQQAGYASWANDRIIWGENLYADVNPDFAVALSFLLSDSSQGRIVLNPRYREIGIGIGEREGKLYWTLKYGAQPNTLPIFINDGAAVANTPTVAVRLSQEDAVPQGEGNFVGKVLEVKLSDNANFPGANWQTWAPLIEYKFDSVPGIKTLFVQYRDGSGRTTIATGSVRYDPTATNSSVAQPIGPGDIKLNETPTVIVTLTPEPTLTPTPAPTAQPIEEATPTAVVIGGNVILDTPAPSPIPQATQTTPALQNIPTAFLIDVDVAATNAPPATPLAGVSTLLEPVPTASTENNPNAPSRALAKADVDLPNWVLPVYAFAQSAIILFALWAFFRKK